MLLTTFFEWLFLENCVMPRGLWWTLLFTKLFCGAHFSLYHQNEQHVEGAMIIESSLGTRQCDSLKGPLFTLAHYWALLETITWASSYIFPSLLDNIHIVEPMSEITHAFEHLLTQLAFVGLKVKVSKCKLWSPLNISPSIEIFQGYTLVTNGVHILGVPMGF